MELPIVTVLASVLTLVTLVTATPYGYGVKSGASAKAEATAVAGPFGNVGPVPLSIPSGASYSGSFSKASASSFASSSASSSSSSFSFSGSGANGIPDIGAAGLGSKGCSTGSCTGGGANGSPLNGAQQFGGTNAVATAQAKALSGSYTPCLGSKCNLPEKCTSGQCSLNSDNNHKAQEESSNSGKETSSVTECIPGQCDKDKEREDSDDSNDFAVNIDRNLKTKPSYDVSGHYSNKQKPSESGCSNGKCGSTNSYPNSATYNQNRQPVPASYLTTPNFNEPCTTPNCNYPTQGYGPQNGGLPSSYNVPLQSATNPPNTAYPTSGNGYGPESQLNQNHNNPGVVCTSSNCNSGSTSNGYYQFSQGKTNNQRNCISGRCDPHSPEKPLDNGGVSGTNAQSFSPSNRPSGHLGQTGCTTPNCAESTFNQPNLGSHIEPAYSTLPENKQNNNCRSADCKGSSYTGSSTNPSDAPVYTGGFGGPAGSIDTPWTGNKEPGNAVNQYNPTHSPGFEKPIGSFGTASSNDLGSSSHYGSASTPIAGRPTGTFVHNKPSHLPSPTGTLPSYTSGITHPGNNGVPSSATYNSGGSPAYNGGLQSNTDVTHSNSGYNAIHGSFGVTKPNTSPNYQSGTTYTGGFGGPTGTSSTGALKPGSSNCGLSGCHGQSNPYDIAGTPSHTKPTYTGGFGGPTGTLGFPSPTLGSGIQKPETAYCGYAGCNEQVNQNSGTAPNDITKANGVTPSQTHPTYNVGYGDQTGTLGTASPPTGSGVQKPENANCGYAGCKGQVNQNSGITPHDITKPNRVPSSQTHPTYTGGFGGPTGGSLGIPIPTSGYNGLNKPGTSNCGFAGCNGQSNNNGGLAPHDAAKPTTATSSQTKPTYTGGFGGPAGTIDTPNLSSGAPGAHQSGTANCGHTGCSAQPDVNANGKEPDTSGYTGTTVYDKTKPNTEISSQTKPAYTGGFGGPSGFLKPNEFSVPSTPLSVKSACTTGHCIPKGEILSNHNQGHSLSGAQSLASASASSNAVAYTGGFGGPPGVLKPYDEGKIESPSHGKGGIGSPSYNTPSLGVPSADGKNENLNNGENHAVKSQASASATATAGGYSSNGPSGACKNGCPNNGSNGDGDDLGFPAGSVASAKSVAGAKSFGLGGSFASSSATAHASAGAATKGGYGRK